MSSFSRVLRLATFSFPVWVLAASVAALWQPRIFTWFSGDLITWGLGTIMLSPILDSGLRLIPAVFLLHSLGFLLGDRLSRILGGSVIASRTVSIEVGMQNSGLGVVLAGQNFPDPLVAVPSAISSLFHSVIASVLAASWRASAGRHHNPPSP